MLQSKELASPEQTTSELVIPGQTATSKESSNPFMAGSFPKTIHFCDSLQSDEDSFELIELMILCTNFLTMVLDLENTKTSQQSEIASLKKRSLGDDASKQGRIDIGVADEDITLILKLIIKQLKISSSSNANSKVHTCSTECEQSYAQLKKLYDTQKEQLGDASIEIQAYPQALKKCLKVKTLALSLKVKMLAHMLLSAEPGDVNTPIHYKFSAPGKILAVTTVGLKPSSFENWQATRDRRIFRCWFHFNTTNELAIPGQTTTGKESSNPFMAGSLPKTIHFCDSLQSDEDSFELIELMILCTNFLTMVRDLENLKTTYLIMKKVWVRMHPNRGGLMMQMQRLPLLMRLQMILETRTTRFQTAIRSEEVFGYILLMIKKLTQKKLDVNKVNIKFRGRLLRISHSRKLDVKQDEYQV
ncbi:hypothetical protein Tco_0850701 [Tanacetum coccineum]